ncbi:MAG: SBBP repeat-containing protein [Bryobacteraceae bacterium]|jgi:uncharacterized protein (TIGR03437 family)
MTRSIVLACFGIALAAGAEQPRTYGTLPLSFAENQGQAPRGIRFVAQGPGYRVLLSSNTAEIGAGGKAIRMALVGAAPSPRIEGAEPLWPVHYLVGRDPSRWRTNVQTYGRVLYHSVYPGIDLVYYGNERRLEYDFTVAPGADPRAIRIEIRGSENMSLSGNGDLMLGPLHLRKPLAYQTLDGVRREVSCAYQVHGRRVSFRTGSYDRARPLVIDPVFVYSTYLGGSVWDEAWAVAVDRDGNTYVAGMTSSPDFPVTPSVAQPGLASAFIARLNPAGTALVYATYFGGTQGDDPERIAVDEQHNVYVLGQTASPDFPIVNPLFQPPAQPIGTWQYFLAKLSPDGSRLLYSTLMPDAHGWASGLALDPNGNVWLTGAGTANWPWVHALQEYVPLASIYQTADRGVTWQPAGALPGPESEIVAVAVDPKSPLNLYAVTSDWDRYKLKGSSSTFHRSTDGGRTWTSSATALPVVPYPAIAFDPVSPSTLYLGTRAGVFRSTDSGGTWLQAGQSLPIGSIAIHPQTPTTLYAGTGDPQAPGPVYKSTNGGANWTAAGISAFAVAVDARTPATVYGAGGNGIYKSTDAGATWKPSSSGITPNAVIHTLAIDPITTTVLYAAGTGRPNFVHKSTDGGATWQPAVGGLLLGEVNTLALNPLAPSQLFTAAGDGISVSIDGAETWAPVARQLRTPSYALAIDPSSGALYAPLATPTAGSTDPTAAFVTEINASGSKVLFSTPLGGSSGDSGLAIALDTKGRVYVAGSTSSPDFPLLNPLQPHKVGYLAGFLTVLAGDGSAVLSSTYLDGAAWALALDAGGDVFMNASPSSFPGNSDLRIVTSRVDPFAPALLYSVSSFVWNRVLAVDRAGNAYLWGWYGDSRPCASYLSPGGWLTKLDPTGVPVSSLCIGGSSSDWVAALAADDSGGLYAAGSASSPNLATLNAFQPTLNGPKNAFVAKIDTNTQLPAPALQSVVGAASFRPEAIAPGSLVALFGAGLASGVAKAGAIPLPKVLIDAVVSFNGVQAPLLYVSPDQVNAQVPFEVAAGAVTVSVARGSQSASLSVTVAEAGPGIFTRNAQGSGPGAILHAGDLSPVSDASPAHPGEAVAIYCTGLGRLREPVTTGDAPPLPPPETVLRPEVRVAGRTAVVTYSGAAPLYVGLYQVNIELSADTPAGLQPLVLSINGVESNTVQVAVR